MHTPTKLGTVMLDLLEQVEQHAADMKFVVATPDSIHVTIDDRGDADRIAEAIGDMTVVADDNRIYTICGALDGVEVVLVAVPS